MLECTHAVIMAGGGGTRLWPASRQARPKQSLQLLGERTLFQMAVERLLPALPAQRILVVTVAEQAEALRRQAPQLGEASFLIEPAPKGTAAVIGLAAIRLSATAPEAVMACLTADHYIGNPQRLLETLAAAEELAGQGALVTLGIAPSYPATGYGYIHIGPPLREVQGLPAHRVLSFTEKPAALVAQEYLRSGDYAWNSGMFVWRADRILQEIRRLMPELYAALSDVQRSLGAANHQAVLGRAWAGLRSQTIDYGVMEKAEGVVMLRPEGLKWFDIGSWDRLFEVVEPDQDGNLLRAGRVVALDTRGTLIYQSTDQAQPRLVAALGLEDLVVIDTDDALMICRKDQAERVKELVQALGERGLESYL
jgi:mannose-1-phosphate guanylyltransferase